MSESQRLKYVILATSFVLMSSVPISTVYSDIMLEFKDSPGWLLDFMTVVPGPMSILSMAVGGVLLRFVRAKQLSAFALALVLITGLLPIPGGGIWTVIASRCLVGFGLGLLAPIVTVMSAQYYEGAERDRIMGYRNASQAIGSVSMMLITMALAGFGWRWSFSIYLTVIPSLIILMRLMPPDASGAQARVGSERPPLSRLKLYRATFYTLLSFMYLACLNTLAPSLSKFLVENSIAAGTMSGIGMCAYMLGSFLSGMAYGRISRVFRQFTLVAGLVITILGIASIAVARALALVVIGCFLQGVGATIFNASSIINATRSVHDLWKPGIIHAMMIFTSLGSFSSPFLMDSLQVMVFNSATMRGRFIVAAVILSAFSIIALFLHASWIKKHVIVNSG